MQSPIVALFALVAIAAAAPASAPKEIGECRFCIDILHLARDKIEQAEGKYFNNARDECSKLPNALLVRACLTFVDDFSKEITNTIDGAYNDVAYCNEILRKDCLKA